MNKTETKLTYKEYLKTPDDQRFELIEGDLLMAPSPNSDHQRISREIEIRLYALLEKTRAGEVFYAPLDVYLSKHNVYQPDIIYVSRQRSSIVTKKGIKGAPDLVVEIVSESNRERDTIVKKRLYAKFGVREYWIVDPRSKKISVYSLAGKRYEVFGVFEKGDTLQSGLLRGLKFKVSEVFPKPYRARRASEESE